MCVGKNPKNQGEENIAVDFHVQPTYLSSNCVSPEGASTKALRESLVKEVPPSLKNTTVAVLCGQGCCESHCRQKELPDLNGDNGSQGWQRTNSGTCRS